MPCTDNSAVVLVVKGSAAKVNKPNICPLDSPNVLSLQENENSLRYYFMKNEFMFDKYRDVNSLFCCCK